MTRVVVVFEDATAMVGGVEADALGERPDLPFLTEGSRLAAAKRALSDGDRDAAEAIVERDVIAPSGEGQIVVTFVAPPDWDRFGEALWHEATGTVHSVFTSKLMLVDGAAVLDCVGAPFADEDNRRQCALWCLRNGLEDMAARVANTPVGGDGPHCTWLDADLNDPVDVEDEPEPEPTEPPEQALEEHEPAAPSNVVELFGGTFPRHIG